MSLEKWKFSINSLIELFVTSWWFFVIEKVRFFLNFKRSTFKIYFLSTKNNFWSTRNFLSSKIKFYDLLNKIRILSPRIKFLSTNYPQFLSTRITKAFSYFFAHQISPTHKPKVDSDILHSCDLEIVYLKMKYTATLIS